MVIFPVYVHKINIGQRHWFTFLMGTERTHSQYAASLKNTVAAFVELYKDGVQRDEDFLARYIWAFLYAQIPLLTASKHKEYQHKVLEDALVDIGLPPSKDLQWIAGPMLWYAREISILPPAQNNGTPAEPWLLDKERYENKRKDLDRGFTYYGDWMMRELQSVLSQQR